MNKLQERLDFLLDKYSVETKAELKDDRTVVIDGKEENKKEKLLLLLEKAKSTE